LGAGRAGGGPTRNQTAEPPPPVDLKPPPPDLATIVDPPPPEPAAAGIRSPKLDIHRRRKCRLGHTEAPEPPKPSRRAKPVQRRAATPQRRSTPAATGSTAAPAAPRTCPASQLGYLVAPNRSIPPARAKRRTGHLMVRVLIDCRGPPSQVRCRLVGPSGARRIGGERGARPRNSDPMPKVGWHRRCGSRSDHFVLR